MNYTQVARLSDCVLIKTMLFILQKHIKTRVWKGGYSSDAASSCLSNYVFRFRQNDVFNLIEYFFEVTWAGYFIRFDLGDR